jgi:hypothetical protein
LKAKAFKDYWTESSVTTKVYQFSKCTEYSLHSYGTAFWEISDDRPTGWSETCNAGFTDGTARIRRTWGYLPPNSKVRFAGCFLKFNNIGVDQGETIEYAKLYLQQGAVVTEGRVSLSYSNTDKLYVVEADDPSDPSSCNDFLSLNLWEAGVQNLGLVPQYWNGPYPIDNYLNVTSLVQHVVDRVGWASGNDLMLVIRVLPYPIDNPRTGLAQNRYQELRDSPLEYDVNENFSTINISLTVCRSVNSVTTTTTA